MYGTLYWSLIVTLALSCCIVEILELLYAECHFFPHPTDLAQFRPKFLGVRLGLQCESKKSPLGDLTFFPFFHKRLRIYNRFFTYLLNVPIFVRLQIFIQLSQIWTKLCHIKRGYPVHIMCAKCPKRAKTCAFRRLRKSLIALLIVVCGKSL